MAFSRFWNWLRSAWHSTTVPVGLWMRRTAEEVLLTCWPPAPLARKTCISTSAGFNETSTASISGRTATVAALVWIRPPDSVSGTRWTRWTPDSNFSREYAPSPSMRTAHSFTPPSSVSLRFVISVSQPRLSAYMVYIRRRVRPKRAPSSPPTPARISRITLRRSLGSLGRSRTVSSRRRRCASALASASSSWASSRKSGSWRRVSASSRRRSAAR